MHLPKESVKIFRSLRTNMEKRCSIYFGSQFRARVANACSNWQPIPPSCKNLEAEIFTNAFQVSTKADDNPYCSNSFGSDATSGAGTAYPSGASEFTPSFWWGSCYSIFSFICMFCRSLFVLLYFFFWPLCCLFFFDIRMLIAPLVSSNSY